MICVLTTKILNKISSPFEDDPYLTVLRLNKDLKYDTRAEGIPPINFHGFFD